MVVVFVLGLIVSSLLERRAEVVSIYNNRKHMFKDSIVSQNELFAEDFPREYQTWANTTDTTYKGEFNSSQPLRRPKQPAPRWWCCGLVTPSLWSTIPHEAISMRSTICVRSYVRVHLV